MKNENTNPNDQPTDTTPPPISQSSPTETPQPKSHKKLIILLIVLVLILAGTTAYFASKNYQYRNLPPTQKQITTTESPLLTIRPTSFPQTNTSQATTSANQKVEITIPKFMSQKSVKMQEINEYKLEMVNINFQYPSDWKMFETSIGYDDVLRIAPPEKNEYYKFIDIQCPRDNNPVDDDHDIDSLSDPDQMNRNAGGYLAKYFKKSQINGFNSIQYVWGTPDHSDTLISGQLKTEIQNTDQSVVCTIWMWTYHYPEDAVAYQQIVESFSYN